jgi:amidase
MGGMVYDSAVDIARQIRRKEVSCEEVARAFLDRIAEVNPRLNAVVELRAEEAMAEARAADVSLARGEAKGPLHGVPMTIKEAIAVGGMIWSGGTKGRVAAVAQQDATSVRRLREAGAIVLGTTNVPELSFAYESDNLIYGRTNNPYDLARTPGGSTGGEAAILAAGGSALGLGGDYMGSIRVPAAFCGIAGLRPNPGRVPGTGYFPAGGALPPMLAALGPMARRVEDLYPMLSVIAGPHGRDPFAVPVALRNPEEVDVSKLRVAFYTDNGIMPPAPEVKGAVLAAARAMAEAGAVVVEERPPGVEQSLDLFLQLMGADGGAGMRWVLEAAGTREVHPALEQALQILGSQAKSAAELFGIWTHWNEWRAGMLAFMQKYDAVLSPVCAQPAMPHGTTFANIAAFSYVHTWSFAASPAAVVRAGASREGLPIGVQIVPHHWREDVALAVARHIEAALGGWKPSPMLNEAASHAWR